MKKVLKLLDEHAEEYLAFAFFSMMLFALFVQVVLRYGFRTGTMWADETAKYSFQWLIYLGISLAMKRDQHIRIDAALSLWPKKLREAVKNISFVVMLVFGLYIAAAGVEYTVRVFKTDAIASMIHVRMGFVYLAIPVGFSLMCIRIAQRLYKEIREFIKGRQARVQP